MAGYIDPPLETDPDELATTALEYLAANIAGWVPRDAALEVWLIQVLARMVAEARDVASNVPKAIFRWYGRYLVQVPPIDAAPSRVGTTWTMVDAQGYTVPAGTVVAFRTAGDELVPFRVMETFVVSPGATATLAGSVQLEALEAGAQTNGLTGRLELVDALAYVANVTAPGATAGGVDAEDDDAYLNRLRDELELLTPRPILAPDFAVLARRVPGVHRAVGIDNYNPADGTTNNERMVAVAVVDARGETLPAATQTAVRDYLDSLREVNFVVHVIAPSYTVINVVARVRPLPGYDPATVAANVRTALSTALDPGVWGGGDLTPPEWRSSSTRVRYTEIASLIDRVEGVDYVETASLRVNNTAADVVLNGAAPLTRPGTLDVAAI